VKKKKSIKKDEVVPKGLSTAILAQQITSDYVLELYEKSKSLKGKKKTDMLAVAEKLSKHVGKWLVE